MKTSLASRFPRLAPTLRACVLFAAVPANAALLYWDTTPLANGLGTLASPSEWGTDVFWNTSSTGATPGSFSLSLSSADDVLFNNLTTGGTVTISGAQSASSIAFGGIDTTLSGGTSITLGGTGVRSGIFNTSAGAKLISTPILLNAATSAFSLQNSHASGTLTLGNITGGSGVSQTLNLASSGAGGITLSGVIANGASGGTVALNVDGGNVNTIRLTGLNTYTGVTTINRGTLNLDFSAQANDAINLINSANTINFAGSGARLLITGKTDGGTNSQAFGTKTYTSGAIAIRLTSNGTGIVNFDLGTVTRNNNLTLDLTRPTNGNITIGNSLTNGIIGPWATVGNSTNGYTDYATTSGGNVVALGAAATNSELAWTDPAGNYTLNATSTLTASRTFNTLRYINGNNPLLLGNFDLTVNGILTTGNNTFVISSTGSGGVVIGSSNELVLLGNKGLNITAPVKSTGSGQTITLGNNTTVINSLISLTGGINTTADGVRIVANGNNANVLSGTMSGTASTITLSGPGTLSLGNVGTSAHSFNVNSTLGGNFTFGGTSSSYTGSTTLTAGSLSLANTTGTITPLGNGGTVFLKGGVLVIPKNNGLATINNPFVMEGTDSVAIRTSGSGTNSNQYGSSSSLTLSGTPTITFDNATNADNIFSLNFASLRLGSAVNATFQGTNSGMNTRTSGSTISTGVELLSTTPNATVATITSNVSHPNGQTPTTAAVRLGGVFSGGATGQILELTGTGSFLINGLTAGTNNPGIEIDTAGTVGFSGSNTYTGGTTLTSGTILVTAANVLPSGGVLTINNGTFNMQQNQEIAGLSGSGGTVVNTAGSDYSLTVSGSGTYSYAGDVVPATPARVRLVKNGIGTQVLTSLNSSYTFNTINNGVLEVKRLADGGLNSSIGAGAASASNLVFGAPGATLRYSGSSDSTTNRGFTLSSGAGGGATLDASGIGKIVFTTGTAINYGTNSGDPGTQTRVLTLTGTSIAANEFGKVLANNGGTANLTSLVKSGTGTWILSGANTYTGTTSVNEGTLLVNGSLGNTAVTVAPNATLGGRGTIAGTLSGAGLVSPGNSPGILTVGQIAPSGGMDFSFEFTQSGDPTWNNAAASGNDVLRLTNADAFTANLTADNVLDYYFSGHETGTQTYRGSFFSTQDFTSDLNAATHNYFVELGGTFYALNPSLVTRSVVAATANFGAGNVNGFTQEFAVTIPEPGTLALLGLALAALALSRRRR